MLDFDWLEVVVISKFPVWTCDIYVCFFISIIFFSWNIFINIFVYPILHIHIIISSNIS